jgi:hypothetical protein
MTWQASHTHFYQQFRVNRTTKQSTPSGSYCRPTHGPLTLTWEEELCDTWSSLFMMQHTPLSHQTWENGPILWMKPTAPGRAPAVIDEGTASQPSAAIHSWEEYVLTFHTYNTVQQALMKQFITVFEPLHLAILNDNMVGFANITDREMLGHLFLTYGSITAVDFEHNFEQMHKAWDPQQPLETPFKHIQDCADFSEAGGVAIDHAQKINLGYAKTFATCKFISACRWWNEKETSDKTWANFKVHFAVAHCHHKQIQGESYANSDYHSENTAVGQTEDQMAESTIDALKNLATATATDHSVVATLTEENSRLARKLEDRSTELKEVTERVREHYTLLRTSIVGHMDTIWQRFTQARVATIPRTNTSVRPLRIKNMGGSQATNE